MAGVKRPQRPKPKGLVFSSSQKRGPDNESQDESITTKRIKVTRFSSLSNETKTDIPNSTKGGATSSGIATNFLVMSDTHGKASLPEILDVPVDVVLHCGDLSDCGQLEDYENTIGLLATISAPLKLVIAGNHDLTLDKQYWEENTTSQGAGLYAQARELWTGKKAQEAGITFLEHGMHQFTLSNGAKLRIYANSSTPNGSRVHDWAFGYPTSQDLYNPPGKGVTYSTTATTKNSTIEDHEKIDVIMTHGPAKYRLDKSSYGGESIGCPHLFRALRRLRPAMHVFGHAHSQYGAEVVQWTKEGKLPEDDDGSDDGIRIIQKVEGTARLGVRQLNVSGAIDGTTTFVNAALMGHGGILQNKPWLAQMELKST